MREFYHNKITVFHSVTCTCSSKIIYTNIPKIYAFQDKSWNPQKKHRMFMCIQLSCFYYYLSLNLFINYIFVWYIMKFVLILGPIPRKNILLNLTVKTIMTIALWGCYVQLRLMFCAKCAYISVLFKKHFLTPTFVLKHLRKV